MEQDDNVYLAIIATRGKEEHSSLEGTDQERFESGTRRQVHCVVTVAQ